jgi:NADH-quinone oxidoreductase subunit N
VSAAASTLVQSVDYAALAPALLPALGALAALVVDLVLPRRPGLVAGVALVSLLAGLVALVPLREGTRATFCAPPQSGVVPACSYVADHLALSVQLVLLAGGAVVVLLTMAETALPPGELQMLLLASIAGAVTTAAARDLATLVVALELVSLPSFALVALRRDAVAGQAALTAFLTSVAATAVTVLGVAFVYAGTGTLFLQRTAPALAEAGVRAPMVLAGLVLVLAAPSFKLAAVPFHAWAPDTYLGAPLPFAAYLSVVSKGAGLVALLAVTLGGFAPAASTWTVAVGVLAAATLVVGNLGALRQQSVVRLLAWSSIAQAGYLVLPVAAGAVAGLGGLDGLVAAASVAYLAAYAAMNLGAFAVVGAAAGPGRRASRLRLQDLRGLARTRPLLGLPLVFFLACLAGLPPGIVGLVTKMRVLEPPVRGGTGWLALLAVVAALATVVGLAYYLRFAMILLAAPAAARAPEPARATVRPRVAGGTRWAVGLTLAVTVVLSLAPSLVIGLLTP